MRFSDTLWHKYLRRPYRLHVVDHGGNGPVVILLHGIASSSANWANLVPLLKADYRCITIDLIGFGESPKPEWYDYRMEDHLRNIQAAIRGLHLRQPYILIGHSLGSLLATRYTREHERQVARLVLLSPPVYPPLDTIKSVSARRRASLLLRLYKFLRTHPRATPQNIVRLRRIIPIARSLRIDTETWPSFTRSLEHCIEQQTIIEDIVEITVPVDIFYGSLDSVVIPYNVRALARLADVGLHPLRGDHNVSKRYAARVARFLAQTHQAPAAQTQIRNNTPAE